LFITRDGGRNWQVQRLSLPASLPSGRMDPIGLPRFVQPDSNQGILPAEFHPTNGDSTNFATMIYSTHDGGLNWQPTTPVKFCAFGALSPSRTAGYGVPNRITPVRPHLSREPCIVPRTAASRGNRRARRRA